MEDFTLDEDQTPDVVDEETLETEPETTEEGTAGDTPTPEPTVDKIDYEHKFSESSKEAQRLLQVNREIEEARIEDKVTIQQLQKENEEILNRLKDDNPESFNAYEQKQFAEKQSLELAKLREDMDLRDFISSTPEAVDYEATLRNMRRAFPDKSFTEIFEENFSSVVQAKKELEATTSTARKTTAPETGEGTSTRNPSGDTIGGYPVAEFNKLPTAKRRSILAKQVKL